MRNLWNELTKWRLVVLLLLLAGAIAGLVLAEPEQNIYASLSAILIILACIAAHLTSDAPSLEAFWLALAAGIAFDACPRLIYHAHQAWEHDKELSWGQFVMAGCAAAAMACWTRKKHQHTLWRPISWLIIIIILAGTAISWASTADRRPSDQDPDDPLLRASVLAAFIGAAFFASEMFCSEASTVMLLFMGTIHQIFIWRAVIADECYGLCRAGAATQWAGSVLAIFHVLYFLPGGFKETLPHHLGAVYGIYSKFVDFVMNPSAHIVYVILLWVLCLVGVCIETMRHEVQVYELMCALGCPTCILLSAFFINDKSRAFLLIASALFVGTAGLVIQRVHAAHDSSEKTKALRNDDVMSGYLMVIFATWLAFPAFIPDRPQVKQRLINAWYGGRSNRVSLLAFVLNTVGVCLWGYNSRFNDGVAIVGVITAVVAGVYAFASLHVIDSIAYRAAALSLLGYSSVTAGIFAVNADGYPGQLPGPGDMEKEVVGIVGASITLAAHVLLAVLILRYVNTENNPDCLWLGFGTRGSLPVPNARSPSASRKVVPSAVADRQQHGRGGDIEASTDCTASAAPMDQTTRAAAASLPQVESTEPGADGVVPTSQRVAELMQLETEADAKRRADFAELQKRRDEEHIRWTESKQKRAARQRRESSQQRDGSRAQQGPDPHVHQDVWDVANYRRPASGFYGPPQNTASTPVTGSVFVTPRAVKVPEENSHLRPRALHF